MKLTIEHLRTNEAGDHEEVPEGTLYGIWRIVEHTGAGWFPWPDAYASKEKAEEARAAYLRRCAAR